MPPITAFQSLVDSTVLAADVGRRLFMRLPARGHELVVFDVNRQEFLASLIAPGPRRAFEQVARRRRCRSAWPSSATARRLRPKWSSGCARPAGARPRR